MSAFAKTDSEGCCEILGPEMIRGYGKEVGWRGSGQVRLRFNKRHRYVVQSDPFSDSLWFFFWVFLNFYLFGPHIHV